jgi:hypothetical protein
MLMKIKPLLKSILYLFVFSIIKPDCVMGQEIKLTQKFVDSLEYYYDLRNVSWNVIKNLNHILKFNSLMDKLNIRETIKVFREGKKFIAVYRDQKLNMEKGGIYEKGLLSIWGSVNDRHRRFNIFEIEFYNNKVMSKRIFVSNRDEYIDDPIIEISNYCDGVFCGEYKSQTET